MAREESHEGLWDAYNEFGSIMLSFAEFKKDEALFSYYNEAANQIEGKSNNCTKWIWPKFIAKMFADRYAKKASDHKLKEDDFIDSLDKKLDEIDGEIESFNLYCARVGGRLSDQLPRCEHVDGLIAKFISPYRAEVSISSPKTVSTAFKKPEPKYMNRSPKDVKRMYSRDVDIIKEFCSYTERMRYSKPERIYAIIEMIRNLKK